MGMKARKKWSKDDWTEIEKLPKKERWAAKQEAHKPERDKDGNIILRKEIMVEDLKKMTRSDLIQRLRIAKVWQISEYKKIVPEEAIKWGISHLLKNESMSLGEIRETIERLLEEVRHGEG